MPRYRKLTGSTSTSTRADPVTRTCSNQARNTGCTATSRRVFNSNRRRCRPRRIASGAGAGPKHQHPLPLQAPYRPNSRATSIRRRRAYPHSQSAPPAAHTEANPPGRRAIRLASA